MFNTKLVRLFICVAMSAFGMAQLPNFIEEGKVTGDFRFRLEQVDQDGKPEDALAATLRSRLGFQTGKIGKMELFLEFENVAVLGDEDYNNTKNGKGDYPVVADPKDTEVNRFHAAFDLGGKNKLIAGRQRIIFDNARFIGNVGWRQNEQTYDGLVYANKTMENFTFHAGYITNVNRIFGQHHPTQSDLRMSTFVAHGNLNLKSAGSLSLFGHFIDLDTLETRSHQNLGFYWKGAFPAGNDVTNSFLWEASYVQQSDYQDGSDIIDANYTQLALGYKFGKFTVKVANEVLEGDGLYGFWTPLATLHAFQGWADIFLNTPQNGIDDLYGMFSFKANSKLDVLAFYHKFESDHLSLDYGDEIDLWIRYSVRKGQQCGLKYSDYSADKLGVDTTKFWAYYQYSF